MAQTPLGLPLLTEDTYLEHQTRVENIGNSEDALALLAEVEGTVRGLDQLYLKVATDVAARYTKSVGKIAYSELLTGYHLLSKEGDLPKIDPDAFDVNWNEHMSSRISNPLLTSRVEAILEDNVQYCRFILEVNNSFPNPLRRRALRDFSGAYMFLAAQTV